MGVTQAQGAAWIPERQHLTYALPLTRGSSFWFLRASRSDCYSGSRHQIQDDLCAHPRPHPA
jgi:hypothetical protein